MLERVSKGNGNTVLERVTARTVDAVTVERVAAQGNGKTLMERATARDVGACANFPGVFPETLGPLTDMLTHINRWRGFGSI